MTTSSDALVSTTVTPHSPLPWRIEVHPDNDVTYIRPAGDGDFWVDAMPMYHDGRNAEFIVRACNSFDALVEAAKHAVMEWRLHGQLTDSCRKLDAAVAKAEGR